MAHHVCGTATSLVSNAGKLVVVGPMVPLYTWSTATVSNMLKEDGVSPVTTLGDVIFRLNRSPVDVLNAIKAIISEGRLNDFRNVAYTYSVWNGHACMSNAGQVSNGVHAAYSMRLTGYKTVFVAYRITGTPESNQPLFTLGNLRMKVLSYDNTKMGNEDIPGVTIPLDTNGTISIVGMQFSLVGGTDTDLAYIGTNGTSVTHVQNVWLNDYTPAGSTDIIDFVLGEAYPAAASPSMEWYDIQYFTENTMTDLDIIRIRDAMKAQYA